MMKIIRRLVVFSVIFLMVCLSNSYAGENFVTSQNLSLNDVESFVENLFLKETPVGSASHVTIEDIEQKTDRAVVNCDFSYPETPFGKVKHEPRTVIFEREESGKWIHVETGNYLKK